MNSLPKRTSLIGDTLSVIRSGIKRKRWVNYLPSERELAKQLQVSRPTVRTALSVLQKDNWIRVSHGRRTSIQKSRIQLTPRINHKIVTLLCAKKLSQMHSTMLLRINRLQELFYHSRVEFRIYTRPRCFSFHPDRILQSLLEEIQSGCWILSEPNRAVQQWFNAKKKPCIIMGTACNSFQIPCVDINQYALGHHAIGLFLARGYSNIGLVLNESGGSGDEQLLAGFLSPWKKGKLETKPPLILHHDGSFAQIQMRLLSLISQNTLPSALLVGDSASCIATVTTLQKIGVGIPKDIALICRDWDVAFDYISPLIAYYSYSKKVMGHIIFKTAMKILKSEPAPKTRNFLIPEFVEGDSFKMKEANKF